MSIISTYCFFRAVYNTLGNLGSSINQNKMAKKKAAKKKERRGKPSTKKTSPKSQTTSPTVSTKPSKKVKQLDDYFARTTSNTDNATLLEIAATKIYAEGVDYQGRAIDKDGNPIEPSKVTTGRDIHKKWYKTAKEVLGLRPQSEEGKLVESKVVRESIGLDSQEIANLEALFKTGKPVRPSELNLKHALPTVRHFKTYFDHLTEGAYLTPDVLKSNEAKSRLVEIARDAGLQISADQITSPEEFIAYARLIAKQSSPY